MIAIPAIDLRDGACVQLVGGDYAAEKVRLADPCAVAQRWTGAGFRRLHVVDLDAATGRGSNRAAIDALINASTVPVQVGGGLRTDDAVAAMLAAGAQRVVLGTRAVNDGAWLGQLATLYPGRIVVAADVRGTDVVTEGWAGVGGRDVPSLLAEFAALPLAGVLVTAVHREGRLEGPDLPLMQDLAARTTLPLFASGGITPMDDLRALAAFGVAGAILGMALYTGALDPRAVAEEFSS